MAAGRNERISVDRPVPDGDGRFLTDTLMGCAWEFESIPTERGKAVHVFAWRNGLRTRVASYPPHGYMGISFERQAR